MSMKTVVEYLSSVDFDRPVFNSALFEIGRLSSPEKKSAAMRGRFDLAISALVTWDMLQIELRGIKEIADLGKLIAEELDEVAEKESLENELVLLSDDKHMIWYERPRALDYWAVANEMADVLVFVVGDMRMDGLTDDELKQALMGRTDHRHKQLINEMIARTAVLGMDLAEIMILKTEVNMQHRDPSLLPKVRGDGFMKRIRSSIGNSDSQIPHLGQGILGETVLTRLQAPRMVREGKIDMTNLESIFACAMCNIDGLYTVN